jgi:hypothetical protein
VLALDGRAVHNLDRAELRALAGAEAGDPGGDICR